MRGVSKDAKWLMWSYKNLLKVPLSKGPIKEDRFNWSRYSKMELTKRKSWNINLRSPSKDQTMIKKSKVPKDGHQTNQNKCRLSRYTLCI